MKRLTRIKDASFIFNPGDLVVIKTDTTTSTLLITKGGTAAKVETLASGNNATTAKQSETACYLRQMGIFLSVAPCQTEGAVEYYVKRVVKKRAGKG